MEDHHRTMEALLTMIETHEFTDGTPRLKDTNKVYRWFASPDVKELMGFWNDYIPTPRLIQVSLDSRIAAHQASKNTYGLVASCNWDEIRQQILDGPLELLKPDGLDILECAIGTQKKYLNISGTLVSARWCGSKITKRIENTYTLDLDEVYDLEWTSPDS
jgi:hypothetical protein